MNSKNAATNLSSTLTGRMTGVVVNTRGSAPGAETVNINIRGKNSWQGGTPLIIIDGIANRSGFERLNPNDIESISVLKDASAAIYGSRAANGVILVTTKRGKEGKPILEYNGDFGLTQPTRVPGMTRSWPNATYFTEAKRTSFMWTDEEIAKFKAGTDKNLFRITNSKIISFRQWLLKPPIPCH
jgi:TonB-dependent SusC/RagA subfamily outer membrane receptor